MKSIGSFRDRGLAKQFHYLLKKKEISSVVREEDDLAVIEVAEGDFEVAMDAIYASLNRKRIPIWKAFLFSAVLVLCGYLSSLLITHAVGTGLAIFVVAYSSALIIHRNLPVHQSH